MKTFGVLLIDVCVPRSHCIVNGAMVPQSGRAAAVGAVKTAIPKAEMTLAVSRLTVGTTT